MNDYDYIIKVALLTPLRTCFDYLPPTPNTPKDSLKVGCRVRVPFGRREIIGIIASLDEKTKIDNSKLKNILELIDTEPLLPPASFEFITWASKYYQHPLGSVIETALPKSFREGKTVTQIGLTAKPSSVMQATKSTPITLNYEQQQAIQQVSSQLNSFATFLLHGITGSGKTEVYLQLVKQVIANKKQVLILIPEIGLTPQTLKRFQKRFGAPIAVLHSRLSAKSRAQAWLQAKTGAAAIVLGTRSATFVPLQNPGLFIIDEEHDSSFKQQSGFRYSARDLLIRRAQLDNCPIVLGSATPSLESLHNALNEKKYHYLQLPSRVGESVLPSLQMLDIRHKKLKEGLSAQLLKAITDNLAAKGQTLIFLNRRGYAPVLLCYTCGWTKSCKNCDAKMIVHNYPKPQLICHHCQTKEVIPETCPDCHGSELSPIGLGTERLEQALKGHFPQANIARLDRDVIHKKNQLQKIIDDTHTGKIDILLGTQMLAKGHHFSNITLVAILEIDSALFSADFRATERMGQLITQVSGRAGRDQRPGHVIIQTFHPEHPLLKLLLSAGYKEFCSHLFNERKQTKLPPFSYQILWRTQAKTLTKAMALLAAIKATAKAWGNKEVKLLGPIAAPMEKRVGSFHAQLLLQAKTRKTLHNLSQQLVTIADALPESKGVRWSVDVDPIDLY